MPCSANLLVALFAIGYAGASGGFWDRVTSGGVGGSGVVYQSWKLQGGWDWDRLAQMSPRISQSEERPSKFRYLIFYVLFNLYYLHCLSYVSNHRLI